MFNEIALDCGYNDYEMRTLRSQLAKDKYIHMVSGRYAISKRLKDRSERVIAFYRDKLGVEMLDKSEKPGRKTKKATVKSGADE